MALSNAALLANIASGDALTVDNTNDRVGIASTLPTSTLDVVGIVSATAFYGDGSNLDGVASAGLGTAISETAPGDVIYYTDTVLSIAATITVDAPSSSNVAYTQYSEIAVQENIDLIIADGDDFIPDILGLSTEGVTPLVGAGGRIRADNFTNKAGNGAPNFPKGIVITGVATATSFAGNATGLTGTPNIVIGSVTGTTGTFSGNVSVGGTLTYEDVKNIDSVGIVTARTGVRVNAGGIIVTAGISTLGAGVSLTGPYKENITAMGALEVDCSTGNYFTKTISGNSTFTFANVPTGCAYAFTLELTHGSGTVTWPASVKFPADTAPTLTAGKTHLFMFITDTGGTRFRGSSLVDYVN